MNHLQLDLLAKQAIEQDRQIGQNVVQFKLLRTQCLTA